MKLPPSTLIKHQKREFTKIVGNEKIVVNICHDDSCNNGHNSFGITAELWERRQNSAIFTPVSYGCQHEEVVKFFPELKPYIKWHLCHTGEPTHYVANTTYFAGDKDCWGLRKGERWQILSGGDPDKPCWHLVGVHKVTKEEVEIYKLKKYKDGPNKPNCQYVLEYRPFCRVGEGSEPDLQAARAAAIWPDATLEQLCDEKLLLARLPALMEEFKAAVESLGMVF